MINRIKTDDRCTGCNACIEICPKGAIKLEYSNEGFWYPAINEKCIDCGKCKQVCPVYGENKRIKFKKPKVYAAWSNDEENVKNSSSGGIFSCLAKCIIEQEGVVYGAAFSKNWRVEHVRVDNKKDLVRLQGSKYVQSFINPNIFKTIKKDLDSGRKVLFSGTPCQTAAVGNVIGNNSKLVLVDIICHGVPSPKAWDEYLKEIQSNSKIEKVSMRYKSSGWNRFSFYVAYEDGKVNDEWFNDNFFGRAFVTNLFLRKSCTSCDFKKELRNADISLGDFWEAARGKHRELDNDDKGTSVVLISSAKGEEIFRSIKDECFTKQIPYEWVPDKTYALVRSSEENINRNKAFSKLGRKKFSVIVKRYTQKTIMQKVIGKLKK
ncbi:MAG: Coenzyme F420 hydrogenase/dehydrogenase, beta subunit C-terminal domain [Eubacterium sp.]|nr:Coenzyme F420 hydrogenase/dehydrogenase, beta subunit C-terminal domain [Eubacterium sp.]